MNKRMWKKGIVIGLIMLFVGISFIPSGLGNKNGNINNISEECILTNPSNENNYLVVWAGNATVTFDWFPPARTNVTCPPDAEITHNLSKPSTLYLIVMLNATLFLQKNFLFRRGGAYTLAPKAAGILKTETYPMYATDNGKYRECMAVIIPVEIENNITLTINIYVTAKPMFFSIPIGGGTGDGRDVIVHVQLP